MLKAFDKIRTFCPCIWCALPGFTKAQCHFLSISYGLTSCFTMSDRFDEWHIEEGTLFFYSEFAIFRKAQKMMVIIQYVSAVKLLMTQNTVGQTNLGQSRTGWTLTSVGLQSSFQDFILRIISFFFFFKENEDILFKKAWSKGPWWLRIRTGYQRHADNDKIRTKGALIMQFTLF